MPSAIVATAGSADANSYLTLAASNSQADNSLAGTSWLAASTDNRTRALLSATTYIDTLSFIGDRSSNTQALAWPRTNFNSDRTIASDEIPREIILATYDLAGTLLSNPTLFTATAAALVPGVPNRDLQNLKLDVMELNWRPNLSSSATAVSPLKLLPHLGIILADLLTGAGPGVVRVVRS